MILFVHEVSEPTKNIENNIIKKLYYNENQSQPSVSSIHGSVLLLMKRGYF